MSNCFIILAAGESKRFKSNIPKPFVHYKGKLVIQHSIDKAQKSKKIKKIVLVINKKHKRYVKSLSSKKLKIIYGGKTRAESAYRSLYSIKKDNFKNVFLHDAARPNFSLKLLKKLIKEVKKNKCVVPTLKPIDSIKFKNKNIIINLKRNYIHLTQTPQAFDYKELLKLQSSKNLKVSDDVSLFINANKKVKFINGEDQNKKITVSSDVKENNTIKYGIGFDIHRLVTGRKLYLGGVIIKSKVGTLGHSDGDPVLHAITDAILGACKMGDIGQKFSDKNKKYKNIRSSVLLKKIIDEVKQKKYFINYLDINIITETPKISKYKNKIIKSIAKICEISITNINIKGKTTEKLGLIGKEKAIACEVITSVTKYV